MADAAEPRSIEEREERIKEIDERIAEIDAEFTGTVMSDDARDEWNELNAERDGHEKAVTEMRKRRERLRQLAGNAASTERGADTGPVLLKSRGSDIYDLARIRSESSNEDEHRAKLHDNAKRAVERARFPVLAGGRERVQEYVCDLLERVDDRHGTLAKRILATGNPVYDRAFGKLLVSGAVSLTSEEQRQLNVYGGSPVGADGGYAVPFQLDPTIILTNDGSLSPLRQIARVEQITTKTWQGITSEGITVSRSGEGQEATGNEFEIDQPEVSPTRVIADVRFSVEVDQDWSQLRSEIARLLADAKMVEEDSSFVVGNGQGNNPAGAVSTLDSDSEVEEDTPGTFASEDVYTLEEELGPRFRSRARWLANKSTYQQIRQFAQADGHDLWERIGNGQPPELLGYPAHEASAMATPGDGSDARYLLFGDFSQFLIVDRLGMNVEVMPHVVGSNRRWTGQRAVVAIWRNSSLILNHNAFRVLVDGST